MASEWRFGGIDEFRAIKRDLGETHCAASIVGEIGMFPVTFATIFGAMIGGNGRDVRLKRRDCISGYSLSDTLPPSCHH